MSSDRGGDSKHRVGVAFFYHESHSFSTLRTDIESFRQEALHYGDEIIAAYSGTQTEVGGFLAALENTAFVAVPLVAAAANPAGEVTSETYRQIKSEMLAALRAAGELDGLLIALHGAMVVDDCQDPQTDLIKAIRDAIGADLPIAATLDLHANVTAGLIDQGVMCFGFHTYPHVDMHAQGVRAAHALMRQVTDGVKYFQGFAKLPALLPSINMRTASGPMHDVFVEADLWETRAQIVAASVFGGFPYADIEGAGASVIVLATDADEAKQCCGTLAEKLWASRTEFLVQLPDAKTAVDLAVRQRRNALANADTRKPIVLADIADNPQSGGGADTTMLISQVLKTTGLKVLFGAICDEPTLAQCRLAGRGAQIVIDLGGKQSPQFGEPIKLAVEVVNLSDGVFTNTGPMNTGLVVNVNGAAHLRSGMFEFVITGRPITANDPELFAHLGVDVANYDLLVFKVKNHFRAAFEPLVDQIIYVDAPGIACNDLGNLPFENLPEGMWPLDRAATYSPVVQIVPIN